MALERAQPRGRYFVEALGRGLSLLDCFIYDPGPHSLIELSRRVRLGMPTTLQFHASSATRPRSANFIQVQEYRLSLASYKFHMPAISVPSTLALPRITVVDPSSALLRPVRSITTAPRGFEGEGFPVRRAFAGVSLDELDPFIHLDQMGEVEYAPGEPKGTSWHPHRGFETVTYMIDGTFEHRDSNGGGGVITNGDTQWMTAGAGILHIERPPEWLVASGGLFHGLQLWVNLPSRDKIAPARYQDIRGNAVSLLTSPDGGALLRVIAGEVDGHPGPGVTYSPISVVHATLQPGAEVDIPWRPDFNALVYVLSGKGFVGVERRPVRTGQLTVLGAGDAIRVSADRAQDSHTPVLDVYMMGGLPIGEPVAWYGPFVMNTHEELAKAFDDYRAGRLGTIPADELS